MMTGASRARPRVSASATPARGPDRAGSTSLAVGETGSSTMAMLRT